MCHSSVQCPDSQSCGQGMLPCPRWSVLDISLLLQSMDKLFSLSQQSELLVFSNLNLFLLEQSREYPQGSPINCCLCSLVPNLSFCSIQNKPKTLKQLMTSRCNPNLKHLLKQARNGIQFTKALYLPHFLLGESHHLYSCAIFRGKQDNSRQ